MPEYVDASQSCCMHALRLGFHRLYHYNPPAQHTDPFDIAKVLLHFPLSLFFRRQQMGFV